MGGRSAARHRPASLLTLAALASLTPGPRGDAAAAPKGEISLFSTEQEAEQHCPADLVVWVDTTSRIFHYRGQRWYGSTPHGGYACKKEAQKYGFRANRTGK
jgi:hypothetical protein